MHITCGHRAPITCAQCMVPIGCAHRVQSCQCQCAPRVPKLPIAWCPCGLSCLCLLWPRVLKLPTSWCLRCPCKCATVYLFCPSLVCPNAHCVPVWLPNTRAQSCTPCPYVGCQSLAPKVARRVTMFPPVWQSHGASACQPLRLT